MPSESSKFLIIVFFFIIPVLGIMMLMKPFILPAYLFLGGLAVTLILILTTKVNPDGSYSFRQII